MPSRPCGSGPTAQKRRRRSSCAREYDDLAFNDREVVEDFALRLQSLISQLAAYGAVIDDEEAISKYLRVVAPKYTQIALSIEDLIGHPRAVDDRTGATATPVRGGVDCST